MKNKQNKNNSKNKNNILENKFIKDKSYIIILVLIIIIVLAFILANNNTPNDGLTYNKNRSFTKVQKIKGIKFKNIKCTFDGKNSLISYTIINDTDKTIYLNNYDIIVKDKNKVQLTKIVANIDQPLKPREKEEMANQVIGKDLSNAYYMELKLNTKKKNK